MPPSATALLPARPLLRRAARGLARTLGALALFGAGIGGTAAAQTPVQALAPEQLPDFLAAHEIAVVQFTSPDPKCGYCVGADRPFDQIAALSVDPRRAYARVQWQPWRQFPAFPAGIQITKIPLMQVYVRGQLAGQYDGRPSHPSDLSMRVWESVMTLRAAQSPLEPGKPLTPAQRRQTQAFVRASHLHSLLIDCAHRSPEQLPLYQSAMKRGLKPVQADMDGAMRLSDTNPDRWPELPEIAQALLKQRQAWISRTLGQAEAPMNEPRCVKLAQAIDQWPMP